MNIRSILVVCTGNICRSPIAEWLLREALADRGIAVSSAGTAAMVGAPADPFSVQVMRTRQRDISSHRARQATPEMLRSADLILALDGGHKRWISTALPALSGRVFKLGYWNQNADVEDPYRMPLAAFEKSCAEIQQHCAEWERRLRG